MHLPRHRRVCRLCHTGALGDERPMLLECPALADLRDKFSPLVAECSGVMARLVWARNQPMVSRYILACLECQTDAIASIQPTWLPGMNEFPFLFAVMLKTCAVFDLNCLCIRNYCLLDAHVAYKQSALAKPIPQPDGVSWQLHHFGDIVLL